MDGDILIMNKKLKVAFICVHNSCRSQIAEALGKHYGKDVFESYSAGTEKKDKINKDAIRIVKNIYGIDMLDSQYPKLLEDLPKIDIVIKMGCNLGCPYLPSKYTEDWGLEDPTGKNDEEFEKVIEKIDINVKLLINKIKNKEYVK